MYYLTASENGVQNWCKKVDRVTNHVAAFIFQRALEK